MARLAQLRLSMSVVILLLAVTIERGLWEPLVPHRPHNPLHQ